ncbi:hypothetical protein OUZ56_011878 [Daphnia magna]|uniref:Uncharacterized protein n=1 Tax=Daphnia magna TaxID=35525 RepID=A0ABQ9Z1E5_9CRUS|nr:hypothetical protein OUZ56_011878 [Daphnia magna]
MAGYLAPHRKFHVGQGFFEDQDRRRQSNRPPVEIQSLSKGSRGRMFSGSNGYVGWARIAYDVRFAKAVAPDFNAGNNRRNQLVAFCHYPVVIRETNSIFHVHQDWGLFVFSRVRQQSG